MNPVLTGHSTVDAISQLHFSGNIVCNSWRTHVQYTNKRGTYTHHLAVLLLADIVYWYRAKEVRDSETGATIGWKKKFKGEKLQRSYKALAAQMGASMEQVKEASKLLKSLGLITLDFETVCRANDTALGNVMFIGICPEAIAAISYQERSQQFESSSPLQVNSPLGVNSSIGLGANSPIGLGANSPIGLGQITHRAGSNHPDITKTTTKTTPEITLPPNPPEDGNDCVVKENLTLQLEEPGTRVQPPILANLSNQPDSQLQPLNPHEEESADASLIGNKTIELNKVGENQLESLIGNKTMELETVGRNQLELETRLEFRQNFDPARAQNDEAMNVIALRESSTGDEYSPRVRVSKSSLPRHSSPAGIETKIAATQTNPPAVLSHQPELSCVEPNNFGPDEHYAVLPTTKIAAIEPSPTTPNPSQHQAPERLQTDLSFHPRSVANRVQEARFDRNQADLTKNLDGSDHLPWDTLKRGMFDQAFENHMARSLMQYPAYRDLMAGELITKVRKHISAGRYDLKRRDELLIEWEAMQNPDRDDFSIANSNLTAKAAARQAKILRALNMKD